MKRLPAAALLLTIALPLLAASPREALVVTPDWLRAHLSDPDLVLLHVGDKEGYAAAHIPGARFAQMSDVSVSDTSGEGLNLEMPTAEDLRGRLENLGISDASRVVVYYGKDWVSPSTRILFTLDYAGLGTRSSLLDGGMDAWVKAGNRTTDAATAPAKGKLSPLKLRPIVVDAARVRANLGKKGIAIVDGRASAFYDGVDTGRSRTHPHLTGHIAGARSIPFTEITRDDLTLKPAAELEALFTRAGVGHGDAVLGYCHIGQQATAMLFAARTLGHPVLLYDGSFEDWSLFQKGAVENPAKKESR